MKRSLDDFFKAAETEEKKPKESPPAEKPSQERKSLVFQTETPKELPPSYLVSATHNGKRGAALIKLYEPKSEKIYFWYDTTNHKPYCLTNLPASELEKIGRLKVHPGFDHFETVEKYDPLLDQQVTVTKVVAKDPLAIGGRPSGCIRDIIPEEYPKIAGLEEPVKVWEAAIKYYQSYIYDRNLAPGMIYKIKNGQLVPARHEPSEDMVKKILGLFQSESEEFLENVEMWARLLEYPAPRFRRVAIDIEVATPVPTRVPDPHEAAYQIVSVTLLGSDGKRRILLLRRGDVTKGSAELPSDLSVEYYDSEEKLILEVFEALWDYPFVITFNGDDFDLRYLYHRALNHFGLERSQIPIEIGRRVCLLKNGIHIDIYKFFFNRSIQIYAFSQKYRDVTLDEVGKALVGLTKVELDRPLSELTYTELARYNLRDAEITFALTAFDDDLVMKLILAITRIARMPMEDVSRQGVSRWIRNFLHHEHRRRNMLIPNADDILALKGLTATKAIIKGKKYKGAIVVEPVPGVHFNVAVMDFASLYPSVIKVHNLGYQSILCPHEECKDNRVPETPHWICKKRRALESLLIGALRDLRVKWYKPKSRDETLPSELRGWYDVTQSALKVILNASVDYNEPIVLKDPNGNVGLIRIGEFVDECIEKGNPFIDGVNTVAKPPSGWKALCFDRETGQLNFVRVTHVIRHENSNQELHEITLQSGRKVKVTPDHSVFILDEETGTIAPAEVADLRKGDYLIIPLSVPTFEAKLDSINLINEFGKLPPKLTNDVAVFIYDKLPIDQRKTQLRILRALATGEMKNIRQIARDAGLKARCVSKNLRLLEDRAYVKMAVKKPNLKIYQITSKGIENIPLEQILSTKLARKKGKHGYYYIWLKDLLPVIDKIDGFVASSWKIGLYGVGKSKYKVNAIIPFTNELSRLLGYYVSEGHSRFFKNKAGGTTYTVTITNYDDTILKDAEKCVMKAFNLKARRSKRGENLLINSKIVYLLFINVLNLGDKAEDKQVPHIIITGTTENKKAFLEAYYLGDGTARQNEIKLTSKSPTLINQLSPLLMQLNVKGIYLTQDRAVHRLRIRDTTPFVHQKIKRKGYACIVPNKYIADIARRLRKFPYVYKDGKNISRNRAIALLQEYTTKFENSEYVKRLMSFLEGNLGLDKIKEMRRVKCSSNYVYDISVDGAENFIGGYGLICLHNSYGVFGAEAFDLYCPPVAEATAAIGRHVITNTINKAQELGIDVIYGDTDSIFLRGHSQDQIKVLEGWSEKELGMELDVDKSYRYSVFSSRKKNYLGIFPDGSVDVKGMTGKKRHIPAFIKKAFDQMEERLGQVESPGEFEEAKREIRKIIRDRYMRLKQRKWGDRPDELAFHVVLGKVPGAYTKTTPQHVRAALILKDMGYELKAGDLISFVKVMKEPRVKPVQLASNSEIDVDKYVAYLHSTFDQVLDALGLDFDEIIGLTKLERFM